MNELAASPTPAILPAHQTQKDSSTYFIFELKAKKKKKTQTQFLYRALLP